VLIDIFDRWISRRKISLLKSELAHTQDENTKHVLEEELTAEERTLKSTYGNKDRPLEK
jgi:hypothetical protein